MVVPTDDVVPAEEMNSSGKLIFGSQKDASESKKLATLEELSAKIAGHIETLKESAGWPEEVEELPPFGDEAQTVLIEFEPWKVYQPREAFCRGTMVLPHPLSGNRSVALIVLDEEMDGSYVEQLEAAGIRGKIKLIPLSLLELAIANEDREALVEMCKLYNTIIASVEDIPSFAQKIFQENRKKLHLLVKSSPAHSLEATLASSCSWLNDSLDAYAMAVGHAGFPAASLRENVLAAVDLAWAGEGARGWKAIHLRTAATDRVTILRGEDEVEELASKDPKECVIADDVVAAGVGKLMASRAWPTGQAMPAFNDQPATVYLNFLLKERPCSSSCKVKTSLTLPHPLSLDRSVCYIEDGLDKVANRVLFTEILREAGVLGKIKMIPMKLLGLAVANCDKDALDELAQLYDTPIRGNRAKGSEGRAMIKSLKMSLTRRCKWLFYCPAAVAAERAAVGEMMRVCLAKTTVYTNGACDGFTAKVGHAGLTYKELLANVGAAIASVVGNAKLCNDGLAGVKAIQIETGNSETINIYEDNSCVEVEKKPIARSRHIPREEVLNGIRQLKAATAWPVAGAASPPFNDLAATVFLELLQSKVTHPLKPVACGNLNLPRALSLNRSVCVVQSKEIDPDPAAIVAGLKKIGITGKIKVLPLELVVRACENDEQDALAVLVARYDTYLARQHATEDLAPLAQLLASRRKAITFIKEYQTFNRKLGKTLRQTQLYDDGCCVSVKVGFAGQPDEQLADNVEAALVGLNMQCHAILRRLQPDRSAFRLRVGDAVSVSLWGKPKNLPSVATKRAHTSVGNEADSPKKFKAAVTAETAGIPADEVINVSLTGADSLKSKKRKSLAKAIVTADQSMDVSMTNSDSLKRNNKKSLTKGVVAATDSPKPKKKKSKLQADVVDVDSPKLLARKSTLATDEPNAPAPVMRKRKSRVSKAAGL